MGVVLRRLRLKNVASYGVKNNEVSFMDFGYPIYVSGPNGAGKTTFFVDGVSFALFGSAYGLTRGAGKLFVPAGRRGGGEVVLELEVNGEPLVIRRWHDGRGWRVEVRREVGGKFRLVTSSSIEAAKFIRGILGLDYDGFINSVVVRQGDVYSFLDAKPSERRELILNLLNINFEPVRNKIKEIYSDEKSKLDRLVTQLEVLERQLKYKDVEEIREAMSSILGEISLLRKSLSKVEEEIEKLDEEINNVSKELGVYNEKYGRLNELRREVDRLYRGIGIKHLRFDENTIQKVNDVLDFYIDVSGKINEIKLGIRELHDVKNLFIELEKLENNLRVLLSRREEIVSYCKEYLGLEPSRESLEMLSSKIGGLRNRISDIKEKLSILSDASISICPLCGQNISEEHRVELISKLRSDLDKTKVGIEELMRNKDVLDDFVRDLEGLDEEINRTRGMVDQIKKKVVDYDYNDVLRRLENYCNELNRLETELNKLLSVFESLAFSKDDLDTLVSKRGLLMELGVKIGLVNRLEGELAAIDYDKLMDRLSGLRSKRDKLRMRTKELGDAISGLERNRDELNKQMEMLNEYNSLKGEAEQLRGKVRIYKLLDEYVFKESRFPRFLMKAIVEDILEGMVNNILRAVFPNAYVKMVVAAEAKGVDLTIYIDNVRRDVSTLSGGEKTLIGFAIRLAIGSLISGLKGGESIDFLIIDEGFGALDDTNRDLVANAIGNLVDTGIYKQVIVISHEADLMNHPVFKAYIYISKENGVSNIKIS